MYSLNGLRPQNRVSPLVASGQASSEMAFPPSLVEQLHLSESGLLH
jgi:hypothetical protein